MMPWAIIELTVELGCEVQPQEQEISQADVVVRLATTRSSHSLYLKETKEISAHFGSRIDRNYHHHRCRCIQKVEDSCPGVQSVFDRAAGLHTLQIL